MLHCRGLIALAQNGYDHKAMSRASQDNVLSNGRGSRIGVAVLVFREKVLA